MKFICRKVRKEIRSQTHMCFKKRWHQKFSSIGGAYHHSSMKFVCRKVWKEIRSETHMFFKKRWHQRISCIEGHITIRR